MVNHLTAVTEMGKIYQFVYSNTKYKLRTQNIFKKNPIFSSKCGINKKDIYRYNTFLKIHLVLLHIH